MGTHKLTIEVEGRDKGGSGVLKRIGGRLGGLGKLAGAAALGVGGAVAGIGAGIASLATEAAPLEGIENAFQGITETFEGGSAAMLAQMEKNSLGMVAQRDLMQQFNKASQLVSVDFAKRLPEAMGGLAKVAASTGDDMGYLLESLTVGVGRMSPMILDNLGLQVSLSDATSRAAEMFGVEEDQLTKTQQQMGMFDVVLAKLRKNTEKMPDISENATTKMAQMEAQLKNTKDRIGKAVLPIWMKLMGAVAKGAEKILPALTSLFETKLVPILKNVVPIVEKVSSAVGKVIEVIWGLAKGVIHFLQYGEELSASEFIPGFFDLPGRIQEIIEMVKSYLITLVVFFTDTLIPGLATFGQFLLENVIPAIIDFALWLGPKIITGVELLVAFVSEVLIPAFQRVVAWLTENWPKIEQTITTVITQVSEFLAPIIEELVTFIVETVQIVVDWFQANWPLIQETVGTVMRFVQRVITTVLTAISDFWETHGQTIIEMVIHYWTIIKTQIQTVIRVVLGIIRAVMQIINGDWSGAWETIKSVASTVWEGIKTIVSNAIGLVKGILSIALDGIKALWRVAWSVIKSAASNAWTLIKGAIKLAIDKVKQIIINVLDALGIEWRDNWEDIKKAAKTIWDAIKKAINEAIKAVREILKGIMRAIKNLLEGIWSEIEDDVSTAWENIKTFVRNGINKVLEIIRGIAEDVKNAGRAIVENIKAGIEEKWNELTGWLNDRLDDLTGLLPGSEPDDPGSPLYNLAARGRAIIENILNGMKEAAPDLQAFMGDAFSLAGALGAFGSNAASLLKARLIDPAKASIKEIDKSIEALKERMSQGGFDARYGALLQKRMNALLNRRNQLAEKYQRVQSKISALEMAQERLGFLKQQLNLLNTIQKYGLNAQEVLQGVSLGAGANLEDIVTAMTRAIQAISTRMDQALTTYVPGLGMSAFYNQFPHLAPQGATNNFYLEANYRYEDEASLTDDVKLLNTMYGGG